MKTNKKKVVKKPLKKPPAAAAKKKTKPPAKKARITSVPRDNSDNDSDAPSGYDTEV